MLGPLTFELDLPDYANFPLSASAPFLFFHGGIERLFGHPHDPMVMDARTRATYTFPVFSSSLVSSPIVVEFVYPDWYRRMRLSTTSPVRGGLGSPCSQGATSSSFTPGSTGTHR